MQDSANSKNLTPHTAAEHNSDKADTQTRASKDTHSKPVNSYSQEYLRAPNEDDDGYDPYSDRPASTPFFEPDPWD